LTETEDHISEIAVERSAAKIAPINSVLVVVRSGVLLHTFPVCVNLREVAINQDLKALLPHPSVRSEYLGYFFDVFNNYVLRRATKHSTTVQSINTFEFERLLIPVPPVEVQEKIIAEMNQAYAAKAAKAAEAKNLLASIDIYVLAQLGIQSPDDKDNSLQSRMFYTTADKVANWRFDASIHAAKSFLKSKVYPMVKLKDHAAINPYLSFANLPPETLVTFVPMEAISDQYGQINASYARPIRESKGYTIFQEGDVLWAKITPCMQNGKSAVTQNLLNGYGFGSTEYHVFRTQSETLNSFYLHTLLRLKSLRQAAMKFFSGSAGHQRVDPTFFKKLYIPLPSIAQQEDIAMHVSNLIERAKHLRAEGQVIVERAKQEVEAMILGNG
jgi:type I restriction enzyme S subunit